ncbi:MAG TPA: hypothetical protein PLA68_09260 [Panacibacter sp.]|nr:hypothetical protein [Panacibacter sp.]
MKMFKLQLNKSPLKYFLILLVFQLLFCGAQAQTKTFDVCIFGANPNDTTDDAPAINAAIKEANGWIKNSDEKRAIIFFPASANGNYLLKTYTEKPSEYLNNYIFPVASNLSFIGDNKNTVIIKIANNIFNRRDQKGEKRNANVFYGKNVSNVSFSNLTIDMNGVSNLTISDNPGTKKDRIQAMLAIKIEGDASSHNLNFENLIIKNNPGHNDIGIYGNGTGVSIINSVFKNGGWNIGSPSISNKNNLDFSFLYSEWDNSLFQNDSLIQEYPDVALQWFNGGIEVHGSNSQVLNSFISGCNPAIYICSERHNTLIYQMENISVKNTQLLQCANGIQFWVVNQIKNVVIESNKIELRSPVGANFFKNQNEYNPTGIYVANGNRPNYENYKRAFEYGKELNANSDTLKNIIIRLNVIQSVVPDTTHFIMTTGIRVHSLYKSIIDSNQISGMNYAGIQLQGSAWGMCDVVFLNNTISNFKPNYNTATVTGYFVVTDTYKPNSDAVRQKETFKGITIKNNTLNSGNADAASAKNCGLPDKKFACFKAMFFALPKWYAYSNNAAPYKMKPSIFSINNNVITNNTAHEDFVFVVQN